MPNNNGIRLKTKKSSLKSTEAHETCVFYQRFLKEKQAKNTAYDFILTAGLLDEFARFFYKGDNKKKNI